MVAMVGSIERAVIARVTFQAQDTGYAVIQMERDDFSSFTAVGVLPEASKGLEVELKGEWKTNPKYGKQLAFSHYRISDPTGEAGLVAFLATLKGIGEAKAKSIVKHFGKDRVIQVFEQGGARLLEVSGIGEKSLGKIIESYNQSKGLRSLISFLSEYGVSATYAARIYKTYGLDSVAQIKANPYILSEEVRGFGFKRADEVALAMGIAPDSEYRLTAAIIHTLKAAANLNGHCYLKADELVSETCKILALPNYRPNADGVGKQVGKLTSSKVPFGNRLVIDGEMVYQYGTFKAEDELAYSIRSLAGRYEDFSLDEWLTKYEQDNNMRLAKQQKEAVIAANRYGLVVVTGGAGVGKSTISKAVIQSWHERKKRVIAVAPTGKAAQRIREATGLMTASTIHRLLGWNGTGFNHTVNNPIDADAFLIDESSMMDLRLAASLFNAIPPHAVVMLVGDINQLPSVGAGNVLRDVIDSGEVPVIRLTEIFRQAATSRIIQASLAINDGQMPVLEQISKASESVTSDALYVKCSHERIRDAVSWLITDKLPSMGWQRDDIQLLSPMHKGDVGNIALNQLVQSLWNPASRNRNSLGEFRECDRVIQTANDYDKKVFNGDIGVVERINTQDREMVVRFPDMDNPLGRLVEYDGSDLDALMLAYSISVHKAQGSEFPVIVMPVTMSQYMMLQRNLYYTGITRGKKLVVLVGEERAISTAVKNQRVNVRNTALAQRIKGG